MVQTRPIRSFDNRQPRQAWLVKVIMIGCLVVLIYCGSTLKVEAENINSIPLRGDPVASVNLAGNEYRIPVQYLGYPHASTDKNLLMDAVLPDLHPVNRAEKTVPNSERDNQVIILIHDSQSTTSSAFRLNVVRKRLSPLTPHDRKYGLKYYTGSNAMLGLTDEQRTSPKTEYYDELFIDEKAKQPLFIDCGGDKGQPYPGCTLVFQDHGLLYEITFRKSHLGDWQSIERASEKLLESFHHEPVLSQASPGERK